MLLLEITVSTTATVDPACLLTCQPVLFSRGGGLSETPPMARRVDETDVGISHAPTPCAGSGPGLLTSSATGAVRAPPPLTPALGVSP